MQDFISSSFPKLSPLLQLDPGASAVTLGDLIRGTKPRHILMEPILVPFGLLLYLGLKPHVTFLCRYFSFTGKSGAFRFIVFIHNILLCLFSLMTSITVLPLTVSQFQEKGVDAVYCTNTLWTAGLAPWAFAFYLSKYWELLDSYILIIKGRNPSFLQIYHHAVTVVVAYALTASHSPMSYVFVGLNSTVHTVMYAYYALTTCGIRMSGKSAITTMQIIQFVIGCSMAAPIFWMRNGKCASFANKVAVGASIAHALYLIVLFTRFYVETYKKAKTKQA